MTPFAKTAIMAALTFSMVPTARADDLHQRAIILANDSQPIIIAQTSITNGQRIWDIQATTFPGINTADPLVDIGSLTKFVTAVAVLHMIDQDAFALDTPISDLLTNVPSDKANITIHDLLTHSSGLIESTGSDEENLSRQDFLERILQAPLVHPIGEKYLYSNAGYSLLAAVIEVQSGQSFDAYLNEAVFQPNGLAPIGYQAAYDESKSALTTRNWQTTFRRQTIADASWGRETPGWNLIGNGGAVTTAEGFLQFWVAFLAGDIVSDTLVAKALTPHIDEGGGDTFYGYGLVVQSSPEYGTMYWHDGANGAFSAEWRHLTKNQTTVFTAGLGDYAFSAMDQLLDQDG
ncbi:serine hydrolase domain-containing protein [Pseudaestuariivita rosea]|uniref:serine hydrolase domain-containing protein n=1 Tax=Pseudaestuariivita rosea TaxID=2763263 RepID=UPI001ABAC1C1|nr:serine hydrolase domain-containing protein [Pseudaestuariivita rosea]